MNIKSYLKTVALTLPLLTGTVKAGAQSLKTVTKEAPKVAVVDTLKAMEQKSLDIKNVVQNKGMKYSLDAGVFGSKNMPGTIYKVSGEAERDNNTFSVISSFSTGKEQVHVVNGASYTRSFPIKEDLNATAKAGIEGAMVKFDNHDSYGVIYPQVTGGLKYNHKFANNAKVGVKADAGVAQPIFYRLHNYKPNKNPRIVANCELEAGYKNTSAFISGGNDAHMGANIGGGVRVKF